VAVDRSAVDSAEFAEIARKISAADTLQGLLRELHAFVPPAHAPAPPAAPAGTARGS
jgi:hypothetical protein